MSFDLENLGGALKGLQGDMLLAVNYEHNKRVAIGTGVAAILMLVTTVALAILFPPFGFAFAVGVGLAAAATLALGTTSIIHGAWAAQGQAMINDPVGTAHKIAKKHFGAYL